MPYVHQQRVGQRVISNCFADFYFVQEETFSVVCYPKEVLDIEKINFPVHYFFNEEVQYWEGYFWISIINPPCKQVKIKVKLHCQEFQNRCFQCLWLHFPKSVTNIQSCHGFRVAWMGGWVGVWIGVSESCFKVDHQVSGLFVIVHLYTQSNLSLNAAPLNAPSKLLPTIFPDTRDDVFKVIKLKKI